MSMKRFWIRVSLALAAVSACNTPATAPDQTATAGAAPNTAAGQQSSVPVAGTTSPPSAGKIATGATAGMTPSLSAGAASVATAGKPAATSGSGGAAATAGSAGTTLAGTGSSGTAGSEAPQTCPTSKLAPGDSNQTITVGTTTRRYIRHVPTKYDGTKPVPLLIDWHPLTQTGSYQRGASGYAAVADRENFIVLYPDGIDNAWNIGPCCTRERSVDDLGFAKAMVNKIKQDACIDAKRVYAAGYSMGGGMSHYLACNAADIFAAVAPAAFDLLQESEEPCKPARPITVISSRGTSDPIVPYSGGASTPPVAYPLDPIHFLGAEGTFKRWAELNGCMGMPETKTGGCKTYTQCAAGVEVTLCTKSGGGHDTGDPDLGWNTLKRFTLP